VVPPGQRQNLPGGDYVVRAFSGGSFAGINFGNTIQGVRAVAPAVNAAPFIEVYAGDTGALKFRVMAFSPRFKGGVRVAVGDVNGDGVGDVIAATGKGDSRVRVFNGLNGAMIYDFAANLGRRRSGLFVAAGDVNGDGIADIILASDSGGRSLIRVLSGRDLSTIALFRAFLPNFRGGVRLAAADINADGLADIIAGSGPTRNGPASLVRIFDGRTLGQIVSFQPFSANFRDGVRLSIFDFDANGDLELVVGAGFNRPRVKVVKLRTLPAMVAFEGVDPAFNPRNFVANGT
jgi:hypothetical protein